jgi:hypothetical protein
MLSKWPSGRRLAFTTVLCLALAMSIAVLTQGLALTSPMRPREIAGLIVMGTAVVGILIGLRVEKMGEFRDREDEADFELLVIRSEELAR